VTHLFQSLTPSVISRGYTAGCLICLPHHVALSADPLLSSLCTVYGISPLTLPL